VRAVVFDLGGVVVDVHRERMLAALTAGSGRTPHEAEAVLFTTAPRAPSLSDQYHAGHISSAQFCTRLATALGRISTAQVQAAWLAMLGAEREDMLALIAALRNRYRVACYSNTNALHWERMARHYRLLSLFDPAGASHHWRLLKPDSAVFHRFSAVLGLPPAACLLVDDLPQNTAAARACGWQALDWDGGPAGHAALRALL
jgi:putative hydrolase of the HAD superfamily